MSAIGVCFNGRRKVVSVTPTTQLQNVLEEACLFFGQEVSCCKLRKGKTVIDLSLPFRFCSLQPNSSVDLEVADKPSSPKVARPAVTRISLKLPTSSSAEVFTFPATHTLQDLLQQLVQDGKLPAAVLDASAEAEIVYIQSVYRGSQLAATSLVNMGLAGQSARFLLRYSDIDTKQSQEQQGKAAVNMVEPMDVDTSNRSIGTVLPISSSSAAPPPAQVSSVFNMPDNAPSAVSVVPVANASPAELVHALIRAHFDAVSGPAVLLLSKYLFNIYAAPLEPKYRLLFTDNKAFLDRVQPCAGALDFLAGIGFVTCDVSGRRALHLPLSAARVDHQDSTSQESAEAAVLEPAVRALEAALEELQIPREERPVPVNRPLLLLQRQTQVAQVAAQPVFDPYKTFVRRVADVNPDGSVSMTGIIGSGSSSGPSGSSTDTKLALLATRRLELEGEPAQAADEVTEVLLPSEAAGMKTDSADMKVLSESEEKVSGDGRLLAAALMDKIRKPDDAPLTTAAVRALKKAQSEMVYSRTLIRVRLPERMILQRRFHPRHSVSDVYAWVRSCVIEGATFDLYMTPPRKVLPPNSATLAELQFVPATLINLSWTSATGAAGLLPHLLQAALTGSAGTQIPSGVSLVGNTSASSGSGISAGMQTAGGVGSNMSDAKGVAEPKAGRKPSWFKL